MRAFNAALIALALVLGVLLSAAGARAQSFDETLAKFATDDFSDTEEAVQAVATSGNKMAAPIVYSRRRRTAKGRKR